MSGWGTIAGCGADGRVFGCLETKERFSAYLDGALDGHTMASMADHLERCSACDAEFTGWLSMQQALGELGPAQPPAALQAQLRDALAGELDRESYLSPLGRLTSFWHRSLGPACLRFSAGLAAALVLVGSTVWVVGSAAPVQANDDRMADLHPPSFLYSQLPPEPIANDGRFVAVIVDAKVNAQGRVYDYDLLSGPHDPSTRARVEANLLGSVFKPATVFGEPVPGHAVITYTAVSVRG